MKSGGRIPWSVTAICEAYKISSDGKTPHERQCGEPFKGPLIPLRGGSECPSTDHNSVWSQECSSVMYYTRREIWKGDILVADIEELEKMDASEIRPKMVKHLYIPDYRGNSQIIRRRSGASRRIRRVSTTTPRLIAGCR